MQRRHWLLLGGAGALMAGCAAFAPVPPVRVPLPALTDAAPCPGMPPLLVVLLPGLYDKPQDFFDEGFVQALRREGIAAEVSAADAHRGYYDDRSVITRLREDIVLPARARGVKQVWLVGISLGGFGALGYAARHPGEIDGVVALAPYLGRPTVLREVRDAGGPRAWQQDHPQHEGDDLEREIWEFLAAPPAGAPPVILGVGRDDRFAEAHALMRSVLPSDRVFSVSGGHSFGPWRELWGQWLARAPWPRRCGGT